MDAVTTRDSERISGVDSIVIALQDVLSGFDELFIREAYDQLFGGRGNDYLEVATGKTTSSATQRTMFSMASEVWIDYSAAMVSITCSGAEPSE